MARKADIFSVWGEPPQALTKGMTKQQIMLLKRYTEAVTDQCYRLAYDNGFVEGLCRISSTATKELNKQRDRMARS